MVSVYCYLSFDFIFFVFFFYFLLFFAISVFYLSIGFLVHYMFHISYTNILYKHKHNLKNITNRTAHYIHQTQHSLVSAVGDFGNLPSKFLTETINIFNLGSWDIKTNTCSRRSFHFC